MAIMLFTAAPMPTPQDKTQPQLAPMQQQQQLQTALTLGQQLLDTKPMLREKFNSSRPRSTSNKAKLNCYWSKLYSKQRKFDSSWLPSAGNEFQLNCLWIQRQCQWKKFNCHWIRREGARGASHSCWIQLNSQCWLGRNCCWPLIESSRQSFNLDWGLVECQWKQLDRVWFQCLCH